MKVTPIAVRNVLRQKRRLLLLGGAVGLGVLVMVLMDALTGGMTASLKANIASSYVGNLYISGSEWRERGDAVKRILDERPVLDALAASGLDAGQVVRKSGGEATLVYGGKQARLALVGIPWDGPRSALGSPVLAAGSLEGMGNPRGILLPSGIATRLGVVVGESVIAKLATVTGQANVGEFLVVGITSGLGGGDLFQSAYARIETVNGLLGLPPEAAQQLNLFLPEDSDLSAAATGLLEALALAGAPVKERKIGAATQAIPGAGGDDGDNPMTAMFGGGKPVDPWKGTKYSVSTLDDVAGQFTTILKTMRAISLIVFIALLSICMAGIVNTFRMVLIERTKEIGTMRAMGMRSREVSRLFIVEAALMTSAGALAGLVAALAIMSLASLVSFDAGGALAMFLSSGHLLFSIKASSLFLYGALVIGAGALASWGPARSAAALQPVVALRS